MTGVARSEVRSVAEHGLERVGLFGGDDGTDLASEVDDEADLLLRSLRVEVGPVPRVARSPDAPDFCVDALTEAIARYGAPEIVNTDQGSQFTSKAWTDVVEAAGARISMDGKGRWIDNVFIERLWRSVKYEDIYLRAYENGRDLQAGLTRYFDFYNRRPASSVA